jgi:hypothetical protein
VIVTTAPVVIPAPPGVRVKVPQMPFPEMPVTAAVLPAAASAVTVGAVPLVSICLLKVGKSAGTSSMNSLVPADFPTLNKQLRTSGTAPTLSVQAAAGATAAISNQAGNGIAGFFRLTPNGAGIAAGTVLRFTFATARPDTNFTLILTPHSNAARTLGGVIGPTNRTTTTIDIDTRTALTAGSAYDFGYVIVGF